MPFGTILQAVHRRSGGLDAPVIANYTRQVLKGLEYLHSNGLVHCDIKSSNILIGEDGAKISDFGCAKRVGETAGPISGTPMFMAPEVVRGEEQGYASDIWALGCTMIEMASGVSPWPNAADPFSVLHRIACSGESPEIPGFLSEEAKDFLGNCLRRNRKERWTATQLLKHPFLEEFNSESNGKEIQEPISSSPTSILDHGFWNSMEESETRGDSILTRFGDSAADRIRGLAEFSGEPSWEWDENWITVRRKIESDASSSSFRSRDSECVYEDYKCREISDVIVSVHNFERGIQKMLTSPFNVSFFMI